MENSTHNSQDHLSDEDIALYADALRIDKLEQLSDSIKDHVEECQRCKSEVYELFQITEELEYPEDNAHPYLTNKPVKVRQLYQPLLRIAAAITILAGVTYLLYQPGKTGTEPVLSDNTTVTNHSTESVPLAYVPSLVLDGLVNGTMRTADFDVISPSSDDTLTAPLTFEWNTFGKSPVFLKLISNRDSLLFEFKVNSPKMVFKDSLPPGLYYWKLEDADDLLFVGRFYIK